MTNTTTTNAKNATSTACVTRQDKIKALKQLKVNKDHLLEKAAALMLQHDRILADLQNNKDAQSQTAYDIEQCNKKAFQLISQL